MTDNSTFNSRSGSDIKNIKVKVAYNVSTDDADNKSVLLEEESSYLEKMPEQSYQTSTVVKSETDALNRTIVLNSKPALNISSSRSTMAKTKATVAMKNEVINNGQVGEKEPLSELPTYSSTPMKPAEEFYVQPVEANSDESEKPASADENKKEGKVIRLAPKVLSDEEKRKLRAKRFNIIVIEPFENTRPITKTNANRVLEKASMGENRSTPTFETLKKRAERFGENVSNVMKSLDQRERMLKRKLKFLESVTNLKEVEIKKRRAERFRTA